MPAGLQFQTDTGFVQIDQDYFNFGLRQKGTATCNQFLTGPTTRQYATVVITNATAPMIAVHLNGELALYRVSVSGSTWTFFFIGNPGQTFEWYVFDVYTAGMATNFGLEVYNAAGALAYNSGAPPAKIAGVGTTFSGLNSARKYAACQGATGFREIYDEELGGIDGEILYTASCAGVVHDGAIAISSQFIMFETYLTTFIGTDRSDPLPGIFLFDVTGL